RRSPVRSVLVGRPPSFPGAPSSLRDSRSGTLWIVALPDLTTARTPPAAQARRGPRPARTGGGSSGPSAAPRAGARGLSRWGAAVKAGSCKRLARQRRLGLSRSGTVRYAVRRAAQYEGLVSDLPLLEGLEAKRGPKPRQRARPSGERGQHG